MPTVNYAITTLSKVKSFLGITTTANDTLIESIINAVTDFIESYTGGRRFKETTYTNEEYDAPRGSIVFLRQFPARDLSSVQFRGGTIASPTYFNFNANDYLLYGEEGYIKFFASVAVISQPEKSLRFTYKAGYKIDFANELSATHTLPFDLTQAATQIVAKIFERRFSQGIQSESTEGQSITYADVDKLLTAETRLILDKYTRQQITI